MKKVIMLIACMGLTACGPLGPMFARWEGESALALAENSKKVQIEDAKGKLEAAKLLAAAEVERAKGVSQANAIIGDSLRNNEAYLRYLYISNLEKAEHNGATTIYIPTEAGLPILESNRRK